MRQPFFFRAIPTYRVLPYSMIAHEFKLTGTQFGSPGEGFTEKMILNEITAVYIVVTCSYMNMNKYTKAV